MSDDNESIDPQASRRQFLAGAAGALAGAGVLGAMGGASTAAAAAPRARVSSDPVHPPLHPARKPHPHYQRGNFENTKGARVRITLPSGPVTVTIADIEALDLVRGEKAGSHHWHNAFRVTMTGEKGLRIPQGTYPVTVNGKSFDLFVVPIMTHSDTPRFEAIIHRAYHRPVRAHG